MTSIPLFILACVLLIILPGPDTAIVTKNTITGGRKAGMQSMLGTCAGLGIHTVACVAGLSALIVQSAFAFTVLKYIGAIYLCYLGIRTWMNMRAKKEKAVALEPTAKGNSAFKQAFFTNITNPKVAVFFLTFLPQFLAPDAQPFWAFLAMGIIYAVLTFIWFVFYVLLLDSIRTFMNKPATQAAMEAITGTVLVGFGIKLAFEKT